MGYRLIARCESGVWYLWSRTGRNWAKDFPLIGCRDGAPAKLL